MGDEHQADFYPSFKRSSTRSRWRNQILPSTCTFSRMPPQLICIFLWSTSDQEAYAIFASLLRLSHILAACALDNCVLPARCEALLYFPLITEDSPELPSIEAIVKSQEKTPSSGIHGFYLDKESDLYLWKNDKRELYIIDNDEEIQLRICISAYCRLGGHPSYTTTLETIKEKLVWNTLDADVRAFSQGCLVCILSAGGLKAPRPLGQKVPVERVSELLYFDFLYIRESQSGAELIHDFRSCAAMVLGSRSSLRQQRDRAANFFARNQAPLFNSVHTVV
eukprot:IDg8821t1